jgi:calcineurin-like phosphoesterase family protein
MVTQRFNLNLHAHLHTKIIGMNGRLSGQLLRVSIINLKAKPASLRDIGRAEEQDRYSKGGGMAYGKKG